MRNYDPKEVTVSFLGQTIDGFSPDSLIKVSRNNDGWTLKVGASGLGARSRNPDKSGKIEITLMDASPSNAILSAAAQADELRAEGVGTLLIKDRNTNAASCEAQNAWVLKIADFERQKETGETTWTLESDEVQIFHDGLIDA